MTKRLLILTLALVWASSVSAAGLSLSIHDGKVTLDASDVTLRQILVEWARVGRTRIINLERVASLPMTVKLDGVPEEQALDIILRSVPGYVAAPRGAREIDASIYDRILIMPVTTAVAPRPQQGFPLPGVTQLRPGVPLSPGVVPEPLEPAPDPAIAAAAAAGLVALPAPPPPGGYAGTGVIQAPVRAGETAPASPAPPAAAPSNPWNAPVGASRPGLAPPTPPSTAPQPIRPGGPVRPPQADQ